jgi:hypothetical protein
MTTMSLIIAATALVGCGDSDKPKAPSGNTKTTSKPRTPTGKPTNGPAVAFETKTRLADAVEATALDYKQPSVTSTTPKQDGYVWGSAKVSVCTLSTAKQNVSVDWKTWSLRYDDNSIVQAAQAEDPGFPQPAYPFTSHPLANGQCVQGWITFPVPKDKRPATVEYAPHGYLASWTVPPAPAASAS